MIGFLVSALVRRGIESRYAALIVHGGILILALLLAFATWTIWLHQHDKHVISGYESGVQNQVSAQVNAASASANAQDEKIAARDAERANQLQEDIGNAVSNHPVEARRSAGPASSAVLDRLRHRAR